MRRADTGHVPAACTPERPVPGTFLTGPGQLRVSHIFPHRPGQKNPAHGGTRSPAPALQYPARASGNNEDFGIITPASRNLVRHSADLSLCHHSLDLAIVFIDLKRRGHEVYYYSGKHECDFILKDGRKITAAIQVCHELNDENRSRETGGLLEAMTALNLKKGIILTSDQEDIQKGGRGNDYHTTGLEMASGRINAMKGGFIFEKTIFWPG